MLADRPTEVEPPTERPSLLAERVAHLRAFGHGSSCTCSECAVTLFTLHPDDLDGLIEQLLATLPRHQQFHVGDALLHAAAPSVQLVSVAPGYRVSFEVAA